jgi:hypothetical protein
MLLQTINAMVVAILDFQRGGFEDELGELSGRKSKLSRLMVKLRK